jgi:hypothetical protein
MVRPLTVLSPETYEAVLARGADEGVADLLMKKTEPDQRWGQTDWFLAANDSDGKALRLPSMERRFKVLADRSTDFMQRILRDVDSAPANEPK